jgi:hypothetical protein
VFEHSVVAVRATGLTPSVVAADVQEQLQAADKEGWQLEMIQPVIYNSATTGYLLLILKREVE